jgi:hypothetical protein
MAKKNKKPIKQSNRKSTIFIICMVMLGVVCLLFAFKSYNSQSALSPKELKNYQAKLVTEKSLNSERELKNEIDQLHLEENGLTEEGRTYADYCEQDNESGTLNDYFVKTCSQQLVLYVSSMNDASAVSEQLNQIFKKENRFIATYPLSGACISGSTTLLNDAKVSYSKNGDLAINNQLSGGFTILPVDKTKRDKTCETRIQDISAERPGWQWEAGRFFIKFNAIDENNLQNGLEAKNVKTITILVFRRTYFAEAI